MTEPSLLESFKRFADLSQYWHRAHTPDSLAIQELQERQRLLVDIPELIKRLTAFSELGTDAMFATYAKAKAAPPRDDAGQGWRMLADGDEIQEGDEYQTASGDWKPTGYIGYRNGYTPTVAKRRRRIAKNGASDTAGGIRADYQPSEALDGKESQETASKEAWRMLELGETIQEGDEYGTAGFWRPACLTETKVMRSDVGHYRRRVTPPSEATKAATEPPQP